MNTFRKLQLIISYQEKIIQQADRLIAGKSVDSQFIDDLARNIAELRATLKE